MQPKATNRQRIEEWTEHQIDVQCTVVCCAPFTLVVSHQPHVLLVAGDGELAFPLG
ncbi:Uncharacterised protein [Mycobacterium tuberculosis]|nr:Uncharacterised protein [Mycobacterium tuberculosis]